MRKVFILPAMALALAMTMALSAVGQDAPPANSSTPVILSTPKPLSPESRAEVQTAMLEFAIASGDVRELRVRLEAAEKSLRESKDRLEQSITKAKRENGLDAKEAGKWTINIRGEWALTPTQPFQPSQPLQPQSVSSK